MTQPFKLTDRQIEANKVLASSATHVMLFGGSRSGKTFLTSRAITTRALKARKSRHAMLRFRFNAIKASIIYDTFPKMMELCYPQIDYDLNKTDWFVRLQNDSEIWFGGLDDKERTEKILGQEYASIFLNECSQIPWNSRGVALTRLAQRVEQEIDGERSILPLKMYYDENPPDKNHWSYRVFVQKVDPESRIALPNPGDFAAFQINPADNKDNIAPEYLKSLEGLSARLQQRFLMGQFKDANPNSLFQDTDIDKWRVMNGELPAFQRIIIAVDPSGADDIDNIENDEIGIMVGALGVDGNGYLLEDLTVKAGPSGWGRVVASAYDRHGADLVVAETNYGGAMVKSVIQTARPSTPFKAVTASRGKAVRAEPISPLVEDGRIRLVGFFPQLEEELSGFTSVGYTGDKSPNRADAFVWLFTELFPAIAQPRKVVTATVIPTVHHFGNRRYG